MKVCARCKAEKDEAAFYKGQAYCRSCFAEYHQERFKDPERRARMEKSWLAWGKNNPERKAENTRKSDLKRNYGMTFEEYHLRKQLQGERCAICKRTDVKLCVEHCHATGFVRGLTCSSCNTAIGFLRDDAGRALSTAAYLRRSLLHQNILANTTPEFRAEFLNAVLDGIRKTSHKTTRSRKTKKPSLAIRVKTSKQQC
jgi:hypothetical protein